ncbi:TetR/AcrR family transcriptional regulator [Erwinia sp. MMLR14_017]|uniref:TetR/AcrR family transcriptional regulator n=1 Tax=Erwinia sp. MMLR14_017 TaxID=3093842 RepID=UPI00298F55D2|nr:TetR/AcrR family transcriptional regulator [Erwinia sp. MMLR14_017]MDW8845015.1 TetR/AcrR family transcriptional regulator [Erwinia sp. MMLR14_017]
MVKTNILRVMMTSSNAKKTYHHGDLRTTLINAALEIIENEGIDMLSLRACARKANVSHAAPAHHFGTITGLLDELAAEGYSLLRREMQKNKNNLTADSLLSAGTGYIRFAINHPGLFRIMAKMKTSPSPSERLLKESDAALEFLKCSLKQAYLEQHGIPLSENTLTLRSELAWCTVHGYSHLYIEGMSKKISFKDPERILNQLRISLLALD